MTASKSTAARAASVSACVRSLSVAPRWRSRALLAAHWTTPCHPRGRTLKLSVQYGPVRRDVRILVGPERCGLVTGRKGAMNRDLLTAPNERAWVPRRLSRSGRLFARIVGDFPAEHGEKGNANVTAKTTDRNHHDDGATRSPNASLSLARSEKWLAVLRPSHAGRHLRSRMGSTATGTAARRKQLGGGHLRQRFRRGFSLHAPANDRAGESETL